MWCGMKSYHSTSAICQLCSLKSVYEWKKDLINTLWQKAERGSTMYHGHIRSVFILQTYYIQRDNNNLRQNLWVCFHIDRNRSTCKRGTQVLTPPTRASCSWAKLKNYCVAQLFTYCWSCDCFRTAWKYFWLKWALIAEGTFTHTPLVHKHRERNSSDKKVLS